MRLCRLVVLIFRHRFVTDHLGLFVRRKVWRVPSVNCCLLLRIALRNVSITCEYLSRLCIRFLDLLKWAYFPHVEVSHKCFNKYPKIQEPILPDFKMSRFLFAGVYLTYVYIDMTLGFKPFNGVLQKYSKTLYRANCSMEIYYDLLWFIWGSIVPELAKHSPRKNAFFMSYKLSFEISSHFIG